MDFYQTVRTLTKRLVAVNSVVGTAGELNVAQEINQIIAEMPYFQSRPDQHMVQVVTEGQRGNAMAILRGEKTSHPQRTLVLMGHLDTVGTEDYGSLESYATDVQVLPEMLKKAPLSDRAREDLESGAYDFGRGVLDMKSGVANHLAMMAYFSEHPEQLDGNLVFLATCDEEGNAAGVIKALEQLNTWKEAYDLEYIGAINTDYSTPREEEEKRKSIYYGSIGKMLPSFYVVGNPAHVGAVFNSFDPNMLLSAINLRLSYNPDFCDFFGDDVTLPPVSLKQGDLKSRYDVQTALEAYAYFNYFTIGTEPPKVISLFKDVAKEAFEDVIGMMKKRHQRYARMRQEKLAPLTWEPQVYSWEEFSGDLAMMHGDKYISYMRVYAEKLLQEKPDMDLRTYNLELVREAWHRWSATDAPVVIVFNSSTYYPPVTVSEENPVHARLIQAAAQAVEEVAPQDVKAERFYPYIADTSFLYLPENPEGILSLKANTPGWGYVYEHPIKAIEAISMPVVNMGTWGYDGHQWTERVEKDYVYGTLPHMLKRVIELLFVEERKGN